MQVTRRAPWGVGTLFMAGALLLAGAMRVTRRAP